MVLNSCEARHDSTNIDCRQTGLARTTLVDIHTQEQDLREELRNDPRIGDVHKKSPARLWVGNPSMRHPVPTAPRLPLYCVQEYVAR